LTKRFQGVRFRFGDSKSKGREWETEIGVEGEKDSGRLEVTLKTLNQNSKYLRNMLLGI
jgi:hypothetical protein